jgi:hypothetical protein
MMPPAEFLVPTEVQTFVRFGRWDQIIAAPAPPPALRYTNGIWHYARGLAFNAKGQAASAKTERDSLAAIAAAMSPDFVIGFNSGPALLSLASQVLDGEIAAKRGATDDAVMHLTRAVGKESLHYDEPRLVQPVRQNLCGADDSRTRQRRRGGLSCRPRATARTVGRSTACAESGAQKKEAQAAEVDARFEGLGARRRGSRPEVLKPRTDSGAHRSRRPARAPHHTGR